MNVPKVPGYYWYRSTAPRGSAPWRICRVREGWVDFIGQISQRIEPDNGWLNNYVEFGERIPDKE